MLGSRPDLVERLDQATVRDNEHIGLWNIRSDPVDPDVEQRTGRHTQVELLLNLSDEAALGRLTGLELPAGQLPLAALVLQERDTPGPALGSGRQDDTLDRDGEASDPGQGATAAWRPRNRYMRKSGSAAATIRIDASADAVPK